MLILAAVVVGLAAERGAAAEVLGVGNFSHIVGNLERSVEFYRDTIGLEPNVEATPWSDNPAIMRMGATPGAESRIATFRIPGSELGVELIEYRNIDRRPVQVRFQDPGAANLMLRVRDLDPILERVKRSTGRVWTPSGQPVAVGDSARIVFLQDPDGFFIEVVEGMPPSSPSGAPPEGNVLGADFEIIVRDSEETARFYRDGLGYEPRIGESFDDTKLLTDTVNALGGAFRRTTSTIPGTSVSMVFMEFRDVTRAPLATRVQDPGTAILQLFVDDTAELTQRLESAGGTVISEGGVPVEVRPGRHISIVRDPNNLFLELIEAPAQ
ncbi:MAG: VOC family protein [Gammaproteobacteria bacterium]|nr:VOC family protein [Gammaproteobacteria bacterium]